MNRAWIQRHRLWLAWVLIGCLLAVLAVREGQAQWRELSQWRELAAQAASLKSGPSVSLDRLRQSALARQIELVEVDVHSDRWRLRGLIADERLLQAWLQSLRAEGVQPLQWGLEQDAKGLRFDVVLQP